MAVITGTMGPDNLNDTAGDDTITAEAGDDIVTVSLGGTDTADGGDNTDTLVLGYTGGSAITMSMLTEVTGTGISGSVTWMGASLSFQRFEKFIVLGGDGDDTLRGGSGADQFNGAGGTDTITAGGGADIVDGGLGDDVLNGGEGSDVITANAGSDTVAAGAGTDDRLIANFASATTAVVMTSSTGPTIAGYPAPGGTTFSSMGSSVAAGGLTRTYNVVLGSEFNSLWWGPADLGIATDGGTAGDINEPGETLTLQSISPDGLTATWIGTSDVTSTEYTGTVFTKYVATIISGASGWVTNGSIGLMSGPQALAAITGSSLQLNWLFSASTTLDGTYEPLQAFYDGLDGKPMGHTGFRTNINGQFVYDDGGASGTITETGGRVVTYSGVESFTITTGSEADTLYGGVGNDDLTMGARSDFAYVHQGGNDTVRGDAGNDFIFFGAEHTNDDTVDGGAGTDRLALLGDYIVTFDADSLTGIERLMLYTQPGEEYDYDLTTVDANVAAGTQLEVAALSLTADESLIFNGSAETDGFFWVRSGAGDDIIAGGAQGDRLVGGDGDDFLMGLGGADRITGGLGADTMNGGAGADTFDVVAAAQSTGLQFDTLQSFNAAEDRINVSGAFSGWGATGTGKLDNASFEADIQMATAGKFLAGNSAVKFTVTAGDYNGSIFVIYDANADGNYTSGTDYVFRMTDPITTNLEASMIFV